MLKLLIILFASIWTLETSFIKYEEEGTTAILTINFYLFFHIKNRIFWKKKKINSQKALNALNSQVLDELDKTLESIDVNKIRALIITGAGEKSFIAGADMAEMSTLTKKQWMEFSKKGNDEFIKIEAFPIQIIAEVNVFALGGGCEISMSCNIRICSDNAIFGQPEVGLELHPTLEGPKISKTCWNGNGKANDF